MKLILLISFMFLGTGCAELPGIENKPQSVEEELTEAILDSEQTDEVVDEKKGPFAFLIRKESETAEPEKSTIVASSGSDATAAPKEGSDFLAGLFGPKTVLSAESQEAEKPENKNSVSFLKPAVIADVEADVANPAVQTSAEPPENTSPKPGVFAKIFATRPTTATADVDETQTLTASLSETLPNVRMDGPLVVACGVSKSKMGKQVDQFPKTGRAVWRLFDSNPNSIQPRPLYITGFTDGCARRAIAALALFGSPLLHETRRYSPAQKSVAFTASDKAYEKLKLAICGVGKGKPCPEKRAGKMEKLTSFVTIYPTFGGPSARTELLLSRGRLIAQSLH